MLNLSWRFRGPVLVAALTCSSCAIATTSHSGRTTTAGASTTVVHESEATATLHGKQLDLHIATPSPLVRRELLVVYASGDGGFFGSAKEQWRTIARDGYATVGFSSRAFLRIERPHHAPLNAANLANEYEQIVDEARRALGWPDPPQVILVGWSRGAAFSVLAGSEPAFRDRLVGVVAIGLDTGENLTVDEDDDTDDGSAQDRSRHSLFDTYARLQQVPARSAVIQATQDNYLPATEARARFGPDTDMRRFFEVEAKNHRFSGGTEAFDAALMDALTWLSASASTSPP